MKDDNLSEIKIDSQHIIENKELSIWEAMIPVLILMAMLAYNIFYADGVALGDYSNQYILLIAAGVAAIVGFYNKVSITIMVKEILENLKSVFIPIIILLMVGALAGTWLISGIIPAMVYYGLQVLSPDIFLPASVIIAAIISIATGSSWTTSATVGIALVGIGSALGINTGMIAGAVISGAYFGDKMSPLSDTTNLAPAMAGTDLFTHIKYMAYTTIPTIVVTILIFAIIGFNTETTGNADIEFLLKTLNDTFNITPMLFIVPLAVVVLILFKTKPIIALTTGVLLAAVFAVFFQPKVLDVLSSSKSSSIVKSILTETKLKVANGDVLALFSKDELNKISSDNELKKIFNNEKLEKIFTDEELTKVLHTSTSTPEALAHKVVDLKKLITLKKLTKLYTAKGMNGMLWTIYLIICAMIFGGIMDAIGALARITKVLLKLATSIFGLFTSTVVSCLGLNIIASDQYLAIVIPGKMFKNAYEDRGLAPENLSRTLEDSGTVTSALIPWNTCGAYQSGVLGVGVGEYFMYAIFNWLSPLTTLLFALFSIKIRQLVPSKTT